MGDDWPAWAIVTVTLVGWNILSAIALRFSRLYRDNNLIVSSKLHDVTTIAHRGSKLEGLIENSMGAFKSSVELKIDMVELDVWLTKDGEVVVFHDPSLARMCGGKEGSVIECNYTDLPPLVSGSGNRASEPIPLFRDVLAAVGEACLIVEVKQVRQNVRT